MELNEIQPNDELKLIKDYNKSIDRIFPYTRDHQVKELFKQLDLNKDCEISIKDIGNFLQTIFPAINQRFLENSLNFSLKLLKIHNNYQENNIRFEHFKSYLLIISLIFKVTNCINVQSLVNLNFDEHIISKKDFINSEETIKYYIELENDSFEKLKGNELGLKFEKLFLFILKEIDNIGVPIMKGNKCRCNACLKYKDCLKNYKFRKIFTEDKYTMYTHEKILTTFSENHEFMGGSFNERDLIISLAEAVEKELISRSCWEKFSSFIKMKKHIWIIFLIAILCIILYKIISNNITNNNSKINEELSKNFSKSENFEKIDIIFNILNENNDTELKKNYENKKGYDKLDGVFDLLFKQSKNNKCNKVNTEDTSNILDGIYTIISFLYSAIINMYK